MNSSKIWYEFYDFGMETNLEYGFYDFWYGFYMESKDLMVCMEF